MDVRLILVTNFDSEWEMLSATASVLLCSTISEQDLFQPFVLTIFFPSTKAFFFGQLHFAVLKNYLIHARSSSRELT